jgi:hypothetical protein
MSPLSGKIFEIENENWIFEKTFLINFFSKGAFFKSFKLSQKLHYVLFGLNKMCKAHFHPFAVIISPFHAMGVKIYKQKAGVPPPPGHRIVQMPWREHCNLPFKILAMPGPVPLHFRVTHPHFHF